MAVRVNKPFQYSEGLISSARGSFNFCTTFLGFLIYYSSICFFSASSIDFITSSQFIEDPSTLSSGGFKLGFFSPGSSTNRYVGIWFFESEAIWLANRNQPLKDSSGVVTILDDGNLAVLNGQNQTLWSSNVPNITTPNTTAQLLDNGNLVLKDSNTGMTLWESFQHPCDTLVKEMKLGSNPRTGKEQKLTSWKSPSDPSKGSFSATLERLDAPEVVIWNGSRPYWRTGPWNGLVFLGVYIYGLRTSNTYLGEGFIFTNESDGTVSVTFNLRNKSDFAAFKLTSMGKWYITGWQHQKKGAWTIPFNDDKCNIYGLCGAFGSCDRNGSPICSCLSGFEPRNFDEWNRKNWTSGCVRKEPFQCEGLRNGGGEAKQQDGFMKLGNMKVPDLADRFNLVEDQCRTRCLENCSCLAHAYDATIGCMSWSVDLIDMEKFPSGGVDLHVRLSNSEIDKINADNSEKNSKKKAPTILIIVVTIVTVTVAVCAYMIWTCVATHAGKAHSEGKESTTGDSPEIKLKELALIEYEEIATATNNFHSANKLGQGGFGSVYKGELQNGQQIAVKRLSRTSGQGLKEFMNEVLVISQLQHCNLVKLYGYCVQRNEKMLIYEYMPNKSLDAIIFDPTNVAILDWRRRFNIIEGIARGLLYLHRDSRLKIIYRDLKASNILLDEELNPKISDFGLAKIIASSDSMANTRRVAGTLGYMSPEYAIEGLVSEKSDVYSFGVLLLEIVGRKKNFDFYNEELPLSLLGYVWKLWNEENIISLVDSEMRNWEFHKDILRCVHIGLLCVQEFARDRPTMATVTSMLNSEIVDIPPPKEPAYTRRQAIVIADSLENNVTITELEGR